MKQLFSHKGIEVFCERIILRSDETMRAAERRVASQMAGELFGAGTRIVHDADGAPAVENADVEISVSHGAGRVVMAVGKGSGRIGIDIEGQRPQLQRVARRFVAQGDSGSLSLLQLWTAKEAAFKAAGISSLTIGQIVICGEAGSCMALLPDGRSLQVYFHHLSDGTLIALVHTVDA